MGCSELNDFSDREIDEMERKSVTTNPKVYKGFQKSDRPDSAEKFQLQQPHSGCCNWNFSALSDRSDFGKPLYTFEICSYGVTLFTENIVNFGSENLSSCFLSCRLSRVHFGALTVLFMRKMVTVVCLNHSASIQQHLTRDFDHPTSKLWTPQI